MKTIRIFISSPGDVITERTIAKRVIRKLQSEFGNQVKLDALLWEDLPLQAIHNFQEGIDLIVKPDGVDIAVFILWSRLGSSPGKKHIKPDGTPYRSGTEYEFDVMYEANKQSGGKKPALLAYIKDAEAAVPFEFRADTARIKDWLDQKEASKNFIKERFYDPVSKTVWGAYHQFDTPTSFEEKLTEHLRHLIREKTGIEDLIEWEGNPYVGLRSYNDTEESLFYGRRQVINDIENRIIDQLQVKSPSLFLLGPSGSGKSSLVKAGLIPDLTKAGLVENTQIKCNYIQPSQFMGKVFDGITHLLSDTYPSLINSTLWLDLLSGQDVDVRYLADVLNSIQNKDNTYFRLMLFLDQFEELFTDTLITEDERIKTLSLLDKLVSTNCLWFLFSMRNDFYEKFTLYPLMSSIKEKSIVYDVPSMQLSDIQQVVEEPARKAGLKWEMDKSGISLNSVLINDIARFHHSLPLVEMALFELYKNKSAENILTYEAYSKIGRVSGSIVNYVDEVYNNLSQEEKDIFEDILGAVITVNSLDTDIYLRKTVDKVALQKSPLHTKVIDLLVNKHILISSVNDDNNSTITIVHEILIESWHVIQKWIEKERKAIQLNNYYETQAAHWSNLGKSKENLINEKYAIKESEHFMYLWKDKTTSIVSEFLLSSVRNRLRKIYGLSIAFCVLGLIIFVSIIYILLFVPETYDRLYSNMGVSTNDLKDSFYLYFQFVASLVYIVVKKYKARPEYLSIRNSLFFWGCMSIISVYDVVDSIINIVVESDSFSRILMSFYLLIPVFVFSKLTEKIRKYYEIKHQWKKGLNNTPRKENKFLNNVSRIALIIVIPFALLMGMAFLGVSLNDKQEKLESSIALNDRLFNGLNNLSSELTYSDNLYILDLKRTYYEELFDDELVVGIDSRAKEYAYLNLQLSRPDSAVNYFGDDYWLRFLINLSFGNQKNASDDLRKYIKSGNKIDVSNPWYVELNGDFDIARSYYDSCLVKGTLNLNNPGSDVLNYAHSLLFSGSIDKALSIYKSNNDYIFPNNRSWKEELANDFRTFRWFGYDNKCMIDIETKLKIAAKAVYTLPSDTGNISLKKKLIGKWRCDNNGQVITLDIADNNLLYNSVYDSTQILSKSFSQYRLSKNKDNLFLEEFNFDKSQVSSGIIRFLNPDKIEAKIIDNGDASDNGKIRIYKKVK